MLTDPIADMLSQIKNGYRAGKGSVELPWSRAKEQLAKVLVKNNYLQSAETRANGAKMSLIMNLKYEGKVAALEGVQRVSRPSLRVYVNKERLPRVVGGLGVAIISTPRGLMTDGEARKAGLGGEVWCKIW